MTTGTTYTPEQDIMVATEDVLRFLRDATDRIAEIDDYAQDAQTALDDAKERIAELEVELCQVQQECASG